MKNMKFITAVLAIALAVGGAFITQAEVEDSARVTAMFADSNEATQMGYYKLSSNPANCQAFSTVNCNPIAGPSLCKVTIDGQLRQLYDSGCGNILYTDPVQ